MKIDNCECCRVPDYPRVTDFDAEDVFTCSDCACYKCIYLHECEGQCSENYLQNH